uniref:Uncharacterized protein n=1 Tax=Anopheles dirus TaxID=7168 RepID=A0A182NEA0_9DIPT
MHGLPSTSGVLSFAASQSNCNGQCVSIGSTEFHLDSGNHQFASVSVAEQTRRKSSPSTQRHSSRK